MHPTTPRQLAANRANAAISTGPRTSQGKASSSRNATSHGLCAAQLVICRWESQLEFDNLRNDYIARHRPIDRCELDQVDHMVDAIWRRNRILSIETALMDLELSRNDDDISDRFNVTADGFLRMALAFEKKHGEKTPEAIQRYAASLDRAFSRARRELQILQGERFNQMPPDPDPEPEPLPDQAEPAPPVAVTAAKIHVITERSRSSHPEPPAAAPETSPEQAENPDAAPGSTPESR